MNSTYSTQKRVLIISHNPFSSTSNNGKTLSSLFFDFDDEKLAQLYFSSEMPTSHLGASFFSLSEENAIRMRIGKSVLKLVPEPRLSELKNIHRQKSNAIKNFVNRVPALKRVLRSLIFSRRLINKKSLRYWIDDFAPEVIFLVGGDGEFAFSMAIALAEQRKVPLITYVTDDYLSTYGNSSCIQRLLRKRLTEVYTSAFSVAEKCFVIGHEMAEEFKIKFKKDFIPIMNCVDIDRDSIDAASISRKPSQSLRFVYAGGLHLGRDDALCEFATCLAKAQFQSNTHLRLEVFSAQTPNEATRKKFANKSIVFLGGVNQAELKIIFEEADFLIHVESADPVQSVKTRLSVSTKIPEYLASGTCVVAVGPSHLASIKLFKDNELGIVITDGGSAKEVDCLCEVIADYDRRQQLVERAFCFAKMNFDADIVRKQFFKSING